MRKLIAIFNLAFTPLMPILILTLFGLGSITDSYYLILSFCFFPALVCTTSINTVHYSRIACGDNNIQLLIQELVVHGSTIFIISLFLFIPFSYIFLKDKVDILLIIFLYLSIYSSIFINLIYTSRSLFSYLDTIESLGNILFLFLLINNNKTLEDLLLATFSRSLPQILIYLYYILKLQGIEYTKLQSNLILGISNLITSLIYKNTSLIDRYILSALPDGVVTIFALIETATSFSLRIINRIYYLGKMNYILKSINNFNENKRDLLGIIKTSFVVVFALSMLSLIAGEFLIYIKVNFFRGIDINYFTSIYSLAVLSVFFTLNIQIINNYYYKKNLHVLSASFGISVYIIFLFLKFLFASSLINVVFINLFCSISVFASLVTYYYLKFIINK